MNRVTEYIVNFWSKTTLAKSMVEDPTKHCTVHKEIGCAHVDGYLCEMKTCDILDKHTKGELK